MSNASNASQESNACRQSNACKSSPSVSRLFSFVMVFWSHQCDFILMSGELFGGQPLWSHLLGQVAKVVGTCHLLRLLLPHHPPMLSDFGRGVHRDCPGENNFAFLTK